MSLKGKEKELSEIPLPKPLPTSGPSRLDAGPSRDTKSDAARSQRMKEKALEEELGKLGWPGGPLVGTGKRERKRLKISSKPPAKRSPEKAYPLPLPPTITRLPHSYGPPTVLSRPTVTTSTNAEAKHFIAFFPRLTPAQSMLFSSRLESTLSSPSYADPEELAGPALGGVLVLYTRPTLAFGVQTIYTTTWEVHSSYEIEGGEVVGVTWLGGGRRWVARKAEGQGEAAGQAGSTVNGNGVAAGEASTGEGQTEGRDGDDDMQVDLDAAFQDPVPPSAGVNGNSAPNSEEHVAPDDDSQAGADQGARTEPSRGTKRKLPADWKPPRLERLGAHGPPVGDANFSTLPNGGSLANGNSAHSARSRDPAFLVLLSNRRVNLYFAGGLIGPGLQMKMPQFGSSHTPLEVLSCGIAGGPGIVVQGQKEEGAGVGKSKQEDDGELVFIRREQACVSLREEDERIWVAYRTTTRRKTAGRWMVQGPLLGPDVKGGENDAKENGNGHYSDPPSPDVPLALSARLPQTAQFGSFPPDVQGASSTSMSIPLAQQGGPSAQAAWLPPMGNPQELVWTRDPSGAPIAPHLLQVGTLGGVPDLGQVPMGVNGLSGGSGFAVKDEEPWVDALVKTQGEQASQEDVEGECVHVVELKVDFLEAAASLQAKPVPHIAIPSSQTSTLRSFTFTNIPPPNPVPDTINGGTVVVQSANGKRPDEAQTGPDRALGLLLVYQGYVEAEQKGHTRIDLHELDHRDVKLSEAFSLLPGFKQTMNVSTVIRTEWVSKLHSSKTFSNEWLDIVDTQYSTLLDVITVKRTLLDGLGKHYLARLDAVKLEVTNIAKLGSEVSSIAIASSTSDDIIALRLPSGATSLLPCTRPASVLTELAEQISVGMYQGRHIGDVMHRVWRLLPNLDIETLAKCVWQTLESQTYGTEANPEKPGHLLPLLRIHAECLRLSGSPGYRLSLSFLHLLAADQAFSMCSRMIQKRMTNGNMVNGNAQPAKPEFIKAFDLDSVWFMLAHFEWSLDIVRALLREALLWTADPRTSDTLDASWLYKDYPHICQLFHGPSRALIRRICNHAYGFLVFCNSLRTAIAPHPLSFSILPRDPSASGVIRETVRDRLEDSGLRLEQIARVLTEVNEIFKEDQANTDDVGVDKPASVGYDLRVPAEQYHLFPRIINLLANDPHLVRSQSMVLLQTNPDSGIMGDFSRDIVTKERLPLKVLMAPNGLPLVQWRKCNRCGGKSTVYQTTNSEILGGLGMGAGGGMPTRKNGYAPKSCWEQWMKKWRAECICGGGWIPL